MLALSREYPELPRSGDTVFGFAAGLYPTDYPTLPEAASEPDGETAEDRE